MTPTRYVRVAVNAPIKEALTYSVPEDLQNLKIGDSVIVSLGKRTANGVVISESELPPGMEATKIKNITSISPELPRLNAQLIKWAEWMSDYYIYPIGQVLSVFFPPLKKEGRKKSSPTLLFESTMETARPQLTQEQTQCVENIWKATPQPHLLFGVTGSGKTEVYLQLLEKALEENKTGIVLVPEISLTPQLLSRFVGRFGDNVAVLHSHLTDRDRTNQWWDAVEGRKKILIGARSALFCPINDLGIIVVDEEHEPSFKQDEKLKYNARDAAVVLSSLMKVPIVLGSATPSLESWQNAKSGKYQLHQMRERATKVEMPAVEIIDLKKSKSEGAQTQQDEKSDKVFWATPELTKEIQTRLELHEQSALFLNRRGLAQAVLCPGCGARQECPNCSISLTLHAKTHMVCHYCDFQQTLPEICPTCGDSELKPIGLGTELVETDVKKLFPRARTIRADRDEIQNRQELEEFVRTVENREADILIGTQMIAKGLDFPHLTLVGVVLADIALNLPDFRASERSFQLLAQVSGRAGRDKKQGKVIIQTFNPDHPSIQHSINHDFVSFAEQELLSRSELKYPPFGRLMLVRLQGLDKHKVEKASESLRVYLENVVARSKSSEAIEFLGPAEAPLFKVRNKYRYHILIKSEKAISLSRLGWYALDFEPELPSGVKVYVDVDPLNMI